MTKSELSEKLNKISIKRLSEDSSFLVSVQKRLIEKEKNIQDKVDNIPYNNTKNIISKKSCCS